MRRTTSSRMLIGFSLVATLIVTGCAAGGAPEPADAPSDAGPGLADMEPIVLTYSDSNVETAAHVIAMQAFMEQVTEATGGKVTFDTYYAAALHPVTEALSAIQTGLTDITFVSPSNVPDLLPVAIWETTLSQGAIDSEFPASLIEGTPVQMAAYQDQTLADELAKYDATTLATWGTAPNSLICKPEVTAADDAGGKTVRTPGPPFTFEVEQMEMTPVTLPITDVFEGLQRGVIDCFMNVVSPFITLGIWDEAKYFVPANFATSTGAQLLIKKSVLDSLPVEVQQIIFDARVDLLADILESTLARYSQWADEAPGKGVIFADPTTFNEAIEESRDAYTQDAVENAPAGVADPEGFDEDLHALADRWNDVAADFEFASGSPRTQDGWVDLYGSVAEIDWDAYADYLREYLEPYRP